MSSASRACSCTSIQAARSCSRTHERIASSRSRRSSAGISSARWIASACPATSNGLTDSAQSPSSSCAPAFSERMSTPSRSFTSGASFATGSARRRSRSRAARRSPCTPRRPAGSCRSICRSIGIQPSCWKRSLTRRASRWIAPTYSAYSGISCRDGSSSASRPTRPCISGCASRYSSKRAEAAHDVLRRIGAVDAQDQLLRPAGARASRPPRARPGSARARRTPPVSTEIGAAVTATRRPS